MSHQGNTVFEESKKEAEVEKTHRKGTSKEAQKNLQRIAEIKSKLGNGQISYDEAKAEMTPIAKAMNKNGAFLAKAHGVSHRPITAIGLLR